MAKIKRYRPSRLLLYFAIIASLFNCLCIGAVIFSFRTQNRKVSELLSKVPSREVQPVQAASQVVLSTNGLPSLPTLSRFQPPAVPVPSQSPYAHIRRPRPGDSLVQVITHEGEMRYVRYSDIPPSWRPAARK